MASSFKVPFTFLVGILGLSIVTGAALGNSIVPGSGDPYLAGMPSGTLCCSGDSAPAESPVQVLGLTLIPGTALTFSVNVNGGAAASVPEPGTVWLIGAAFIGILVHRRFRL